MSVFYLTRNTCYTMSKLIQLEDVIQNGLSIPCFHLSFMYNLSFVSHHINNWLSAVLLRLGKEIENINLNHHMLNMQLNASLMCLQNIKVVTIDYSERACQHSDDWIASWLFQLSKLFPILELKLVLKVIFYSDKITIPVLLQLNMLQFHIS